MASTGPQLLRVPAAHLLEGCKLVYFNMEGRAESIRLALTLSGVSFEDKRIAGKDWAAMKPTTVRLLANQLPRCSFYLNPRPLLSHPRSMSPPSHLHTCAFAAVSALSSRSQPWGSMPVVVLACGDKIAQAKALLRLAGKAAGIYPSDPIAAAKVDEIVDYCEDIGSAINPIGRGLPSEEKNAARKQAVSEGGKIYAMLAKLDASIAERGAAGHAVGDALTTADLDVFTKTTGYVSFVCVCVWSVCVWGLYVYHQLETGRLFAGAKPQLCLCVCVCVCGVCVCGGYLCTTN